jgi:hypothetical protein
MKLWNDFVNLEARMPHGEQLQCSWRQQEVRRGEGKLMTQSRMIRVFTAGVVCGFLAAMALGQQATIGQLATPKRVDVVMVEMSPYGFSPAKITHLANQHFLFVRNVSGLAQSSLVLKDQNAAVWGQAAPTFANPHWRQLLNLPAGTYTLSETNHPTWSCTITLQ